MLTTRIHTFTLLLSSLALGACVDGEISDHDDIAGDEAAAITGGDATPEPPPSPVDIRPAGVFGVGPGARACFLELGANQSAGIGGSFSFQNFVKYPKLIVFYRRDTRSTQTRIYAGDVVPDAGGFYSKVFNTANGNAGLFPGLFQFCLRNPAVNPGPFFSDAQVVTF